MDLFRSRFAVALLALTALVVASCSAAIRSDDGDVAADVPAVSDGEPADVEKNEASTADVDDSPIAPPVVLDTETAASGSFETAEPPEELGYIAPESDDDAAGPTAATAGRSTKPLPPPRLPAGTELPAHLQQYGQGPARIADVAYGADWTAFEQALQDNLTAGHDDSPSATELAVFERASLSVCAGDETPESAAESFGLDDDAERTLNVFAPAMCHLVPQGDQVLPGPAIGVLDWSSLTEVRWLQGAQWIPLATFDEQAMRACLGLERTVAMAVSTAAQIDALLVHGECAVGWNE